MSPETRTAMQSASGAIREHLWQPTMPVFSGEKRKWSMARELNIFKILSKGFDPADIVGAIAVVRDLRPDWAGRPLSLRAFYWKSKDGYNSTPFLEACIGYHHKNQRDDKRRKGRLPPSIQDTLRRMVT